LLSYSNPFKNTSIICPDADVPVKNRSILFKVVKTIAIWQEENSCAIPAKETGNQYGTIIITTDNSYA